MKRINIQIDIDNDKPELSINFVLDKSGSMSSCLDSTISGFNEYLGTLKRDKKNSDPKFSLTLFDTKVEKRYVNKPLSQIEDLTHDTYIPGGNTALYDAACSTINSVKRSIDKATPVLFIIMTDGEENSSKEYTQDTLKSLIKDCEKDGWTFVYLGANQDAWSIAQKYGLSSQSNVVNYNNTSQGTQALFRSVADSTNVWMAASTLDVARGISGQALKKEDFFTKKLKDRIENTK